MVKSVFKRKLITASVSGALTANSPRQLNILGHDGNPLGVNGAQIRVFEEADHVSLARLLNREDRLRLEPQIGLVLRCNLADQPLEGQLANEQLSRLLELADLSEGDRARSEPMRLLDALVRDICGLAGRLLC